MTKTKTPMEYQKAIDYIFKMIRDGKLILGSKIPSERDLAEMVGIGRNSTREAISILRGLGIVESVHGSGNYISGEGGKSIRQIVSVMLALGTISKENIIQFRRAISSSVTMFHLDRELTEENVKEFREILDGMESASQQEFIMLDRRFHSLLMEATGNTLFITIVKPVAEVYLQIVDEVIQETDQETRRNLAILHRNLFEAIVAHDKEKCEEYMTRHYDRIEEIIAGKKPAQL